MKHFFLDTNVIIDFLANRTPFSDEAAQLFDLAIQQKLRLYVAAVSYNNIYYILRQSLKHAETIKILADLQEWTETLDVTKEGIQLAMKSGFNDLEDAIQYQCAKANTNITCIVTRDEKGFKSSTLSILSPKEALALFYTER